MRVVYLMILLNMVLLTGFFGCGKQSHPPGIIGGEPPKPPPSTPPDKPKPKEVSAVVVLFGGGFCKTCKAEFPKLHDLFKQSPQLNEKIEVQLYYVSGDPSTVRPSQDAAEKYALSYYPGAKGIPDLPWMWWNFKRLLPGAPLAIPAAAVVDAQGRTLRRFYANAFNPYDIYGYVKGYLSEPLP